MTDAQDAAKLLNDLTADRRSLADRLAAPDWLYPAIAAAVALYVSTPTIQDLTARRSLAGMTIVAIALLVWTYQRNAGIRISRIGMSARLTLLGMLFGALFLLSVGYGIMSFHLTWLMVLPVVASFVLTLTLGRLFDRQYREHVSDGR